MEAKAFVGSFLPADWPDGALEYMTGPALRLGQALVSRGSDGRINGYMSWAFVGDDVASAYASGKRRLLHPSEWNEGLKLWIVDLFWSSNVMPQAIRQTIRALAARFGQLRVLVQRERSQAIYAVSLRDGRLALRKIACAAA